MLSDQYKPYTVLIASVFCFLLGLFVGDRAPPSKHLPQAPELTENFQEDLSLTQTGDHLAQDYLDNIVSNKFSCNARSAYEELTRLHFRRASLDEHSDKGEANRARLATIQRKANAAGAAEGAFRSCLQLVVPDLLTEWEENLAKKSLTRKSTWDEKAEGSHHGITLDVLKNTADALDESLSDSTG